MSSFVQDYKGVVQQQIDALGKLKPPANLKAKMTKLLSAARKALAKVVADPGVLLTAKDPFVAVDKASVALGLTECAA
jgi:hypothetical protein